MRVGAERIASDAARIGTPIERTGSGGQINAARRDEPSPRSPAAADHGDERRRNVHIEIGRG
jgi:hypothetical protein